MVRTIQLAPPDLCCPDPLYTWLRLLTSYLAPPTTLAAGMDATQTFLFTAAQCVDFPLPCRVTVDAEELLLTDQIGISHYGCLRHQNGTAAAAHGAGAALTPLTRTTSNSTLLYRGADPYALYSSAATWLDPDGSGTELRCDGSTWKLAIQILASGVTTLVSTVPFRADWSACHPTRLVFYADPLVVADCQLAGFTVAVVSGVQVRPGRYPALREERRNGEDVWAVAPCVPLDLPFWCVGLDSPPPPIYAHFINTTGDCSCLDGLTILLNPGSIHVPGGIPDTIGCCGAHEEPEAPCSGPCKAVADSPDTGSPRPDFDPVPLQLCLFAGDASWEWLFPGISAPGPTQALLRIAMPYCNGTQCSAFIGGYPCDGAALAAEIPEGWTIQICYGLLENGEGQSGCYLVNTAYTIQPPTDPPLTPMDPSCQATGPPLDWICCDNVFAYCDSFNAAALDLASRGCYISSCYTDLANYMIRQADPSSTFGPTAADWHLLFKGFSYVPVFNANCEGYLLGDPSGENLEVGKCYYCDGTFDVLVDLHP